jgi:hypothetical protein
MSFSTSSRVDANPRAMRGSSSSSTPIEPEPSLSREVKYFLSLLISSSLKSMRSSLPCFLSHVRSWKLDWNYLIRYIYKYQYVGCLIEVEGVCYLAQLPLWFLLGFTPGWGFLILRLFHYCFITFISEYSRLNYIINIYINQYRIYGKTSPRPNHVS